MNQHPSITLQALREDHLAEIVAYWTQAHPLHPLSPELLRERLFGPGASAPGLALAARDAQGRLCGLATGVWPVGEPTVGGIRWLGVCPDLVGSGLEHRLADTLCQRLKALGARTVRLFATPPYYLRPGIDTRETALIASMIGQGWTHAATHFNMTVDLRAWDAPEAAAIFGRDGQGYALRRARPGDRPAVEAYMRQHWTEGWTGEALLALDHDPPTLFLAHALSPQGETLVGFAACEANQCLGSFGPTGVLEDCRGAGLGRRLLEACLADLKSAGRPVCEIGWVGPVPFYFRSCGASLGPIYWELQRTLDD